MCLIINREPDFEIPFQKFKSAIEVNPDGYGLTYPDDKGVLRTLKDSAKPDPERLYRIVNEELKEVPLLLHFRYNTAGKTNLRNAHPFPVLEKDTDGIDIRMAHNGTINKYKTIAKADESDTRAFVREFVRPLLKRMVKAVGPDEVLKDPFTMKLLEDQIPSGSVLSFVDGNGYFQNINELGNGGGREDGWYFSNKYSFNKAHRDPTPSKTVYYNCLDNWGDTETEEWEPDGLKDTNVMKFTKKYEIKSIDDLLLISDSTIEGIVEEIPQDAQLLIKELLAELKDARLSCARYKKLFDKKGMN
jgi:hypothetical protein